MPDYKVIKEDGYTIRIPLLPIFDPKKEMQVKPIELSPETKEWMKVMALASAACKEYEAATLGIPPSMNGNPTQSYTNK